MLCGHCSKDHKEVYIRSVCHDAPVQVKIDEQNMLTLECLKCQRLVANVQAIDGTVQRLFPAPSH